MNPIPETIPIQRFLAIDIHKHYVMISGMNQQHQWILRPRKVADFTFPSLGSSEPDIR